MHTLRSSLLMAVALAAALSLVAARPCAAQAASNPYYMDSFWMKDPLFPGNNATPGGPGYWWRDTTNQNAISQFSADHGLGTVLHPYAAPDGSLDVYQWVAGFGHTNENVVAITTPTTYFLVSFGGSTAGASAAQTAFGFGSKKLMGVALAGTAARSYWGGQVWGPTCNIGLPAPVLYIPGTKPVGTCPGTPAPVYVPDTWRAVMQKASEVQSAVTARAGSLLRYTGPDDFLGPESWASPPQDWAYPTVRVPTTITDPTIPYPYLNFTLTNLQNGRKHVLQMIPVMSNSDASFLVWMPEWQILIADSPFSDGFPGVGPLTGSPRSAEDMVSAYNTMLSGLTRENADGTISYGVSINELIYVHGLPVIGPDQVTQALTDQRDAVQYVHDQTVTRINNGEPLDQIVTEVQLPESLASSPYLKQVETNVPSAVKGIYDSHMGWFHGDPLELTSTLTSRDKAQTMAALAGGVDNLIAAARKAELAAQNLPSAEQALFLAQAAYQAGGPLADQGKAIYVQALTKCAYMQQSSQVRHYYLTLAQSLGANF